MVCSLPPGHLLRHPPSPPSFTLSPSAAPSPVMSDTRFLPAQEQKPGLLVGREEMGAFRLHEMEKSTLLSERSWLGQEGSKSQALQSFWNPLFLARPGWGRPGQLRGTAFSVGLGSPLLRMPSALGPGDQLLPVIDENGLPSALLSQDSAREGTESRYISLHPAGESKSSQGALAVRLCLCRNCGI